LVRNVSPKDLADVSVESRLGSGSNGVATPALAMGSTLTSGIANGEGSVAMGSCTFEFKGGRKKARASLCIRANTSASCIAIVEVD